MSDQHKAADIITDAWQKGIDHGIDIQTLASTTLTLTLSTLVAETDRETTIRIAKRLIAALEDGKFG